MTSPDANPSSRRAPRFSQSARLRESFAENGFLTFEGIVSKPLLAELQTELLAELERVRRSGELFEGGGLLSGHLNCFPGRQSRFVYEELERAGVFELVRALSPTPLRQPNVGCNLNLPGSHAQNEHVDGFFNEPFLVVNVAVIDTDLGNGAMQVLCRTHRQSRKLWQIFLERPERVRVCMKQGDVLIRTSTLWHRGMPNPSAQPRPMLAFTWEKGGNELADPYAVHGGAITFLPNRFHTDWRGQMRERVFVTAPGVSTALRVARSLFE